MNNATNSLDVRVVGGQRDVWVEISKLRGRGRIAAIAYLGEQAPSLLQAFKSGDIVVCDASDDKIRSGVTHRGALNALYQRGVRLYSLKHLHAKVICIGDTAVVGSMNASTSSTLMFEAAVFLKGRTQVRDGRQLIQGFLNDATLIDDQFLRRINRMRVVSHHQGGIRTSSPGELESIVIDPVKREEPPRYVKEAAEVRVVAHEPKSGFQIRPSWEAPQQRRLLRMNDIVIWVYKDGGDNPRLDIGRIVDFERIRTRWVYYDLTPTRQPSVRLKDLASRLVAAGFGGDTESLGTEMKRISLTGLHAEIANLFGDKFPKEA